MSRTKPIINQVAHEEQLDPRQMDWAWANGWRHFGSHFFRYSTAETSSAPQHVIPLRVCLDRFALSKSQKRIYHKNQHIKIKVRDARIDDEKINLFERHKVRFTENIPDSLYLFLGQDPATVPCDTKEICLFLDSRLVAVSFWDIGHTATSSIYAMFDPQETKRSLGIYLILLSIYFSQHLDKKYYYPGYAYKEPSHYDYKKRFSGLEYYDWRGEWRSYHSKEAQF